MLRVTVWGNRLWICLREETQGVAITSAWAFVGGRMALVQRAQVLQSGSAELEIRDEEHYRPGFDCLVIEASISGGHRPVLSHAS